MDIELKNAAKAPDAKHTQIKWQVDVAFPFKDTRHYFIHELSRNIQALAQDAGYDSKSVIEGVFIETVFPDTGFIMLSCGADLIDKVRAFPAVTAVTERNSGETAFIKSDLQCKSGAKKNKGKSPGKGYLKKAFSVALMAGVLGVYGYDIYKPNESSYPPDSVPVDNKAAGPDVIRVFNGVAQQISPKDDLGWESWGDMVSLQDKFMRKPDVAKKYNDYIAQFDRFRGEPLTAMAVDVNRLMQNTVTYSDTLYDKDDTHWAAPAETVWHGAGDCKDQAILQYYIMRHLGVSEKRLMIASVSAVGSTNSVDHSVLILNIEPKGYKPDYLVMNDSGPVLDAREYTRPQGADYEWSLPYVFYAAINQDGFWQTAVGRKVFGQKLAPAPASHSKATVVPGMKVS